MSHERSGSKDFGRERGVREPPPKWHLATLHSHYITLSVDVSKTRGVRNKVRSGPVHGRPIRVHQEIEKRRNSHFYPYYLSWLESFSDTSNFLDSVTTCGSWHGSHTSCEFSITGNHNTDDDTWRQLNVNRDESFLFDKNWKTGLIPFLLLYSLLSGQTGLPLFRLWIRHKISLR